MPHPPILYKYASSDTAALILENMRLRWSSPLLFNDAAEFQRMPRFDPTVADAHKMLPEVIVGVVFDRTFMDEARLGAPMKLLLHHVKVLAKNGASPQAVLEMLASDGSDADEKIEAALRAHFEALNPTKARVLCLTAEPSNEVMWGIYAEAHTGCVLGFRHIVPLSTPLLEARPVAYSSDKPVVGSGLDFLLYGDTDELRARTLVAVCFTKKAAWSYEQEWRALTWRPNECGQYGDYLFYSNELESVTLGARVSQLFEVKVRELVASKYPSASVYRMCIRHGELARLRVLAAERDALFPCQNGGDGRGK